jgi:hypothetical protein
MFGRRRFVDPGPIPERQRQAVDWLVDQLCEFDADDVSFVESAAGLLGDPSGPEVMAGLASPRRSQRVFDRMWARIGSRYMELTGAMEKIALTFGDTLGASSLAARAVFGIAMQDQIPPKDYEALTRPWQYVWHDWLSWATNHPETMPS